MTEVVRSGFQVAMLAGVVAFSSLVPGCSLVTGGPAAFFRGELAEPPDLRVRVDGKRVAAARGSSCWSHDGRSICADTIGPPELGRTVRATTVSPGATVRLEHERSPIEGSVVANLWTQSGPVPVALDEGRFHAPGDRGTYTYAIFARWPQGDATHVFRIRVKPKTISRRPRTRYAASRTPTTTADPTTSTAGGRSRSRSNSA